MKTFQLTLVAASIVFLAACAGAPPEQTAKVVEQPAKVVPPAEPLTPAALSALVQQQLGRVPVMVEGHPGRLIRRVGWCTGGAQGYFESAIAAGADAFITGEISEPQAHLARETGVAFLACGHHASERYGAPALAAHLAGQFGLDHEFIDIDNPA